MEPKPGIKSSEFKMIVAVFVLAIANGTEYVNIPWEQFTWLIGLAMGYTGQRGLVKVRAVKDVVAAALNGKK